MQYAPREPEPDSLGSYHRHRVDGVEVFIHQSVVLLGQQTHISLGGFWKFKWLKVGGLASLAACAV